MALGEPCREKMQCPSIACAIVLRPALVHALTKEGEKDALVTSSELDLHASTG